MCLRSRRRGAHLVGKGRWRQSARELSIPNHASAAPRMLSGRWVYGCGSPPAARTAVSRWSRSRHITTRSALGPPVSAAPTTSTWSTRSSASCCGVSPARSRLARSSALVVRRSYRLKGMEAPRLERLVSVLPRPAPACLRSGAHRGRLQYCDALVAAVPGAELVSLTGRAARETGSRSSAAGVGRTLRTVRSGQARHDRHPASRLGRRQDAHIRHPRAHQRADHTDPRGGRCGPTSSQTRSPRSCSGRSSPPPPAARPTTTRRLLDLVVDVLRPYLR